MSTDPFQLAAKLIVAIGQAALSGSGQCDSHTTSALSHATLSGGVEWALQVSRRDSSIVTSLPMPRVQLLTLHFASVHLSLFDQHVKQLILM